MISKGIVLASLLLLNPQWTIGSRSFNPPSAGGGSVTYASADFCDAAQYSTGSPQTTIACTTGTVTVGDALVIGVVVGTNPFPTITDSAGGTITQFASSPYYFASVSDYWQIYCMPNAAAGAHTITLSGSSGGTYPGMIVIGFHGANATSPCTPTTITSPYTVSGFGVNMSAGPVTTTIANSAVVAVGFPFGAYPPTYGTGFTGISSPNSNYALEYAIEATPGSYTPTFTQTIENYWIETAIVVHP